MADIASEYLYDTLTRQGGHIYVCGDVTMAADVLKALHQLFAEVGNTTTAEAEEAMKTIKVKVFISLLIS